MGKRSIRQKANASFTHVILVFVLVSSSFIFLNTIIAQAFS